MKKKYFFKNQVIGCCVMLVIEENIYDYH